MSFFPLLAWDGRGWATDPALRRLDSFWPTSPTADFDVQVAAPSGIRILAAGEECDSSLALVPHETAHQWFQALVGNNQSRDPWLSEAALGRRESIDCALRRFAVRNAYRTVVPRDLLRALEEFFPRSEGCYEHVARGSSQTRSARQDCEPACKS